MSDPLLGSAKRRIVESEVLPGYYIRSLNVSEYRQWRMRPFDEKGNTSDKVINQQDAALFQITICSNAEGDLKYMPEQIPELCYVDAGLGERLMKEIQDHLGVGESAEDFDDTVKNSEETPSVYSATA